MLGSRGKTYSFAAALDLALGFGLGLGLGFSTGASSATSLERIQEVSRGKK
jgi:hypothetical protein